MSRRTTSPKGGRKGSATVYMEDVDGNQTSQAGLDWFRRSNFWTGWASGGFPQLLVA